MSNRTVLTLDVDWAPDFIINFVSTILIQNKIRATWFITHNSPSIEKLRAYPDLFELGIHPNFLRGSTHGTTEVDVLMHCMKLVPGATSLRTHGLFQSTGLLAQVVELTSINTDCSLFLPHAKGL